VPLCSDISWSVFSMVESDIGGEEGELLRLSGRKRLFGGMRIAFNEVSWMLDKARQGNTSITST